MTDKEIAEKAIQKAVDGGYNDHSVLYKINNYDWQDHYRKGWFDWEDHVLVTDFIFDHEFAKALWGEEWPENEPFKKLNFPWWKEQLQRMVIADNMFKYLGENI